MDEPVRINVLESVVYFRKCAFSWTDEDQLFSSDLNNQRIQLTGTVAAAEDRLNAMTLSIEAGKETAMSTLQQASVA